MRCLLAFLAVSILSGCGTNPDQLSGTTAPAATLPLIPYPASVTRTEGNLALGKKLHVNAADGTQSARLALDELLTSLDITEQDSAPVTLTLSLTQAPDLGQEGYRLLIDQNIHIEANTDTGLFYGVQTLRQLLPAGEQSRYHLPTLAISDTPAYPWRGTMLDVARSFLPIDYLKAHIDRMALFKLNTLHLHLSDDQGWRVEIHQYPRLTEIGGASTVKGGRSGFYTQAQLQDLVAYAAERQITLVPEIDLPGHTQAAIASYPELACDDVTFLETYSGLEVGFSKLCLTKPEVIYPFVTQVLTEIAAIFPSQYLHIGGDEIKDPLYGEFIEKTTAIVESLGRNAVAWEEASVAETDSRHLLQLWNDNYDIQPALDHGHKLILSPCSYSYFDHGNYAGQPETYDWCRKQGVPLARAYSLTPENYTQIVGVESAMWSELVHTDAAADNRLWPRVAVTAELGWATPDKRDYGIFVERLRQLTPQLNRLGIDYYEGGELAP